MECRQQPRCDELLELREEVKRLRDDNEELLKEIARKDMSVANKYISLRDKYFKIKACLKRAYKVIIDCYAIKGLQTCIPYESDCLTCKKRYIAHGGE